MQLKVLLIVSIFLAIPVLADDASIARGRYLTVIGGCNDCHTAGFAHSGGKVPESEWLKGDPMGWKGPWGTSYAINLRTLFATLTPEAWLSLAKNSKARPPMPAYAFGIMSDQDLIGIYDYIRFLGAAGVAMPTPLPPGEEPKTPYINFVPVMPAGSAIPTKEASS